jgi:hypothetical protein
MPNISTGYDDISHLKLQFTVGYTEADYLRMIISC